MTLVEWIGLVAAVITLSAFVLRFRKWLWGLISSKRLRMDVEMMRDSYFVQKSFINEEPPYGRIPTVFRIGLRIFCSSERPTGIRDIYIEKVDGGVIESFNPYVKRKNTHLTGDGQEVVFTCSSAGGGFLLGQGFNPEKDSLVLKAGEALLLTVILEGFLDDYMAKVDVELVIVDSKNRKKRFSCEDLHSRAP
ncbi:MAG: hypothetical protein ACE5JA_09265 [bacterium]